MGEVDKPFGCPQPGCNMSFTNEDHLTVHRRRHEMELTNGDHLTPSLVKHAGFIIDQTPTPTRFLRQCEEVGLFQEINLNPFDEQFRRASLLRSSHSITEALGGGLEGSLDTPRVLPPVDSDETISSTSRDDVSAASTSSTTSTHSTSSSPPQGAATSSTARTQTTRGGGDTEGSSPRLSLNVSSASEAAQHTTSVISTPTPVITAGPSVTQALGVVGVGVGGGSVRVGEDASPAAAALATNAGVPPSPSATVLQLLLRLPNGQAIPVEIPATPVVSSSATATTTTAATASPLHDPKTPQPSLAKMRLKQALASCTTAARPGCSKTSRANTADRIAEMTRSRNLSGTSSTEGEGEDDTNSSNNSGKGERRRRHSSDNEDPAEKRKKFLERNRAAAIRCREKKKRWIENLTVKYDELGNINQKLQTEVAGLRSEVAVLKSMLLQHKDCPVTLAMQGDGSLEGHTNHCDTLHPLPPMLACVDSHHTQKPRTRSLSLPSIPATSAKPLEPLPLDPLPVNLSTPGYASGYTSSSAVSSSTKVNQATPMSQTTATLSPVSLTNSLISSQVVYSQARVPHQQPAILKIGQSPGNPILVPASAGPHVGKVTIVGTPEVVASDLKTLNVIMTTPSTLAPAHNPPIAPQLLNLTLAPHQHPHTKTIIRKN